MTSTAPGRPQGDSAADNPTTVTGPLAGARVSPASERQRIVVGVDGSECGAAALEWAVRQAVLLGATLDAVACWHLPAMAASGGGFGAYVDISALDLAGPTSEMLDKAVAGALHHVPGSDAITVRTSVVGSSPARALLQAAEGADLLVVGS
ncbi:MAG: UspA domain protein, partial [Frankiales bacterium]|nr:UspA domain protein [Frankiales bacterium]